MSALGRKQAFHSEDESGRCCFRQMKTLQKFSSAHAQLRNHFNQDVISSTANLHGPPLNLAGRVAERHELRCAGQSQSCVYRRQVAVRLTAPPTSRQQNSSGMGGRGWWNPGEKFVDRTHTTEQRGPIPRFV